MIVAVRCRPFSIKESSEGCKNIVKFDAISVSLEDPKTSENVKSFAFDALFGENSIQADVYNTTARSIVDSVLNGFNGTIFAYGQVG